MSAKNNKGGKIDENKIDEDKNNALKMFECYKKGFEFPKIVFESDVWDKLEFNKSVVLYNKADSLNDVTRMVTEREPVNISMFRHYYEKKLEKYFGYSSGYYERFSSRCKFHHLAPNIAVYARTPLFSFSDESYEVSKIVNVINLVGYAFDSRDQPDNKHFKICKLTGHDLVQKYTDMWKYAFICAKNLKLKRIHMSAVGGGAFAPPHMRGTKFIDHVLRPSVLNAQKAIDPSDTIELVWKFFPDFVVPTSLYKMEQEYLDETLFVNGWDPFSMVGNGNRNDRSLDGAWGMSTALAVLCWPKSNSKIQYRSCDLWKK